MANQIRNNPSQVWLGVTGTNGKTSTVELATALIKAGGMSVTACGNVGDTVVAAVTSGRALRLFSYRALLFSVAVE